MAVPREHLGLIQQAFAAAHDLTVQTAVRQNVLDVIAYLAQTGESQEAIQRFLGDSLLATICHYS